MSDIAIIHGENAPVRNDRSEDSDSSDHDTDTNSDANVNVTHDTSYTDANAEVQEAFKDDDRSVFWWRCIVKIIMILVASTLTLLTYLQLSKLEQKEFEAAVCTRVMLQCKLRNQSSHFVVHFPAVQFVQ